MFKKSGKAFQPLFVQIKKPLNHWRDNFFASNFVSFLKFLPTSIGKCIIVLSY